MKKAVVIGSGFAGLSAACFLAKAGLSVTVLETHDQPGGRARSFSAEGFTFDMGPSWYWMPDVFERFFSHFGAHPSQYYDLVRLDPSYQVVWEDETIPLPADYNALLHLFEKIEKGAGAKLDLYLQEAAVKYRIGIQKLVYKPGLSAREYMHWDVVHGLFRMNLLQSVRSHARQYFSHPKLLQLIEFPVLFLGALPQHTPALYSLMNYADMKGGTWYPMGGMVQIAKAMHRLAESLGVEFRFGEGAEEILVTGSVASGVRTADGFYEAGVVIAACDYHYAEQELLHPAYRNYSESYWQGRDMAPSSLIYYLGLNKKVNGLLHHTLFFDAPFEDHAQSLYAHPGWPEKPLMYVCCPSKTDPGAAPAGCENLFILIPVAPGLKDNEAIRQKYLDIALNRLEQRLGEDIRSHIIYSRSYGCHDFETDYHAFKGNAYGLANTLRQTGPLKPSIRNKKVSNLFYTGQLTVPGPGVPPALISGEVVAAQALKSLHLQTAVL